MNSENIFTLSPVCKSLIWGGTKLSEQYNKICTDNTYGKGIIGESWELVAYRGDVCTVSDGMYAGSDITAAAECDIPVILKYIDAAEPLSVQVHPNKTEMWYIVDADPDAEIVNGLKDSFSEKDFRKALSDGRVFDLLKSVKVKAGDVFFIPSGLVHSLGKGILVAEIQQASTDTYRVYDFNRLHNGKPRELHIDAAMKVIRDYTDDELHQARFSSLSAIDSESDSSLIADCEYFSVYRFSGSKNASRSFKTEGKNAAVMCCAGNGKVNNKPTKKGETLFVKRDCPEFTLEGEMNALVCFFL